MALGSGFMKALGSINYKGFGADLMGICGAAATAER